MRYTSLPLLAKIHEYFASKIKLAWLYDDFRLNNAFPKYTFIFGTFILLPAKRATNLTKRNVSFYLFFKHVLFKAERKTHRYRLTFRIKKWF